jgi:magnesium-transporting ATPase (P-type)
MYIGVEIIRLIQSPIIKYDKYIYDAESKKPTLARTSELPDELGQVNYILSDKTGTLTKNNMILEKISVRDQYFSKEELIKFFEIKYKSSFPSNESPNFSDKEISSSEKIDIKISEKKSDNIQENLLTTEFLSKNLSEENLPELIDNNFSKIENYEKEIIDFYRLSNICNSIVIDYSKNKNSNEVNYQVCLRFYYNYF